MIAENSDGVTVVLNFDFARTFTATADQQQLVVDFWARSQRLHRDDHIEVEFFNGATSVIDYVPDPSTGIPDASPYYLRFEMPALSIGQEITSFQVRGFDTSGAGPNHFRVAEMRVAAIPEPSSAALLGLAVFALILRRRK